MLPRSRLVAGLIATLALAGCAQNGGMTGPPLTHPLPQTNAAQMSDEKTDGIAVTGGGNGDSMQAHVQRGNGARTATNIPSLARWRESRDGISLNFQNAEIAAVAAAVLGDALGHSYMVSPQVSGRVSLQTSAPVAPEAALYALEAALAPLGARLVQDGALYNIVPANGEGAGPVPVVGLTARQMRAGYGLHLVPLRFISADKITELLTPFIPRGAQVTPDAGRNMLLIAGSGPERANLIDMIAVFDVDWMAGMSYALLPLQSVEPNILIGELEQLFGAGADGIAADALQLLPVERLNALLVIAPDPALLDRVQEWVERLDGGAQSAGKRLFVYKVQHGRARDLAVVIGGIFGAEQKTLGGAEPVAPNQQPALAQSSNAGGFGDAFEGGSLNAIGQGQRSSLADSAPRRASIEPQLAFVSETMRVIADDRNNALLIMASPQDYNLVRASLRKLDVEPLQVLIEATIAEVALRDELRYGLQWFFNSGDFTFTLSGQDSGAVASSFPGFSGVFDDPDARVVIDALDSVTDLQVLSSPQLMVLNNQTATLQVGDEVPVPVRQSVSVDNPDAPLLNSIEFRSTGVILRVTPRVNENGMVLLDIEQEVSDVVSTLSSGIDAPTIQQRRVSSTIAVRSGETIALGGLIQTSNELRDSGIPLLKDIPLLGNAFKTTARDQSRTELLILITPRVVGSLAQARAVTDELRARMHMLELKPTTVTEDEIDDATTTPTP
ncbi:MAG: type II secretion system secretin GspD [Sphingomonadales bacterium]